jgi:hypothetical protein
MEDRMLTTEDNPYDPFVQFEEWYAYDVQQGYNTCAYLARIAMTSDELSETDNEQALDSAIDEIMEYNLTGNYKIVYKNKKTS